MLYLVCFPFVIIQFPKGVNARGLRQRLSTCPSGLKDSLRLCITRGRRRQCIIAAAEAARESLREMTPVNAAQTFDRNTIHQPDSPAPSFPSATMAITSAIRARSAAAAAARGDETSIKAAMLGSRKGRAGRRRHLQEGLAAPRLPPESGETSGDSA